MPISDAMIRTLVKGDEKLSYNPQNKEEVDKLPVWATEIQVKDQQIRTIACDNKSCKNSASFDVGSPEEIAALPDWLRTTRTITLGNNVRFVYCSDECEVDGVTTGNHNVPEPKQIQEATPADAQQVIAAAKAVEKLKTPKKGKKGVSLD